jgi:hypothetical protein
MREQRLREVRELAWATLSEKEYRPRRFVTEEEKKGRCAQRLTPAGGRLPGILFPFFSILSFQEDNSRSSSLAL